MASSFIRLLQVEPKKEEVMSCVEYEIVEIDEFTSEKQVDSQRPTPFVVANGRARHSDQVASRVAEVLDFELERGSMPT